MIPSFALALLATALGAQAADMGTANDLSAANNVTSLLGTWSTGSGAVSTGGVSDDRALHIWRQQRH